MGPRLDALLLCDDVIEDKQSGKKTLLGLYENVFCGAFPAKHRTKLFGRIWAPPMTDLKADIRVIDPAGQRQDLPLGPLTVGSNGRAELVLTWDGIFLPAEGKYRILLVVNGVELGQTEIWAHSAPKTPTDPGPMVN